jgi:hypothetical protein
MGRYVFEFGMHDQALERFIETATDDSLDADPVTAYALLAPIARLMAETLIISCPELEEFRSERESKPRPKE